MSRACLDGVEVQLKRESLIKRWRRQETSAADPGAVLQEVQDGADVPPSASIRPVSGEGARWRVLRSQYGLVLEAKNGVANVRDHTDPATNHTYCMDSLDLRYQSLNPRQASRV